MAGISNLGNFNVKQAQPLSKTAEVDTQKAEDKGVGNARKSDILIDGTENDTRQSALDKAKKLNPKAFEKVIILWGPEDNKQYEFLVADENGELMTVSFQEWSYVRSTGEARRG